MRVGHALVLTRMLMLFFVRKVLSVGALRSGTVRFLLAAAAVALAAVCTGAAYFFLRPMADDRDVWQLVLQTTTVSALLWTQCAFLFVKVLFLNSEGLLELSFHLPLTGRERAVALFVYEAAMVLIVASAGLFSVSAAAVLILGVQAFPLVLQTLVLPVLTAYAALSLVHVAVMRALGRTRLRGVAHLISILVLFGLMLGYARQLAPMVTEVSRRYLAGDHSLSVITSPSWFADRFGWPLLLALGVVVVSLLFVAVIALTPRHYVRPSRYLKPLPGHSQRWALSPYDLCLLRSSQTWLAGMAAAAVFVALCLRPTVNPVWATSLLPMGGLYLFAATEPLRAAGWDRAAPWRIHLQLVRAQLIVVAGGTLLALLVLAAVVPSALAGVAPAIGGALVATVLTTFIGVVFPAEHDNPFSIFLGISATAAVGFVLAAALGILQLDRAVLGVVLVVLCLAITTYTVIGIQISQQRRRHEKVVAGAQQPGGWRVAHRRRSRGHLAVPHVLDR